MTVLMATVSVVATVMIMEVAGVTIIAVIPVMNVIPVAFRCGATWTTSYTPGNSRTTGVVTAETHV